jgi:hypothetical protein
MAVSLIDVRTIPAGTGIDGSIPEKWRHGLLGADAAQLAHLWQRRAQQPWTAEVVAVGLHHAGQTAALLTRSTEGNLLRQLDGTLSVMGATGLAAWTEAPLWHLRVACLRWGALELPHLWALLERSPTAWVHALDACQVVSPGSAELVHHARLLGLPVQVSPGCTLTDWSDGRYDAIRTRSSRAVELMAAVLQTERAWPIIDQWRAE